LAVVGSWDDAELGAFVEEVSVDEYGDAEQLTAFEASFEEVVFPIGARVLGRAVMITPVVFEGDEHRGLRAVVAAEGVVQRMDLLDIEFDTSPEVTARLIAAYRRWWVPPG
jgi:hypothetical protein